MKTITYIEMDFSEFDDLVNEHFPSAKGEYEFLAAEECSNDSLQRYNGVGKDYKSTWFQDFQLPKIEQGDFNFNASGILEILCHKGIIEPGDYVIDVCW